MKTKTKVLIAAITLTIMLPFMMVPASANSRSPYWEGKNSSGAVTSDKDIPIEVVSEKLTFDIPTLPYTKYRSGEYFIEYDSKLTAEYTFYNPTDMTITAKMLFPYGRLPEYARLIDMDGDSLQIAELEKYQITVNGQPVEKTVRHSNSIETLWGSGFDADLELKRLSDEMLSLGDFGPETLVIRTNDQRIPIALAGKAADNASEAITLEAYARSIYKEDSGISFVDWFNSIVVELNDEYTNLSYWVSGDGLMLRWYEYEITIGPGEYITNTVTAPIYPDINTSPSPYEYTYTYLLSPASGWADFGSLEIVINTKYEMNESNLEGFEKTDNGYRLVREGLPKDGDEFLDLTFTLLNDGKTPKEQPNPNKLLGFFEGVWQVISAIFVIIFVFIMYLVNWIADLFR